MRTSTTVLMVLLLSLSGLACTEGFDPPSMIDSLRILGVKADNPRLWPNESTQLEALVVDGGSGEFSYTWEICPFIGGAEDGYPCVYPDEAGDLFTSLGGEGATFSFDYALPFPLLVDSFCVELEDIQDELPAGVPLPSCTQGFPLPVRLTVTNGAGEEQVAIKTLYLAPTAPAEEVDDNNNPVVLTISPAEDAPASAVVDEAFPIELTIEEEALETFFRQSSESMEQEELLISWFVRNGKADKDVTFYSENYGEKEEALENEITPEESGEVSIWVVIRDGRGGTDWVSYDFEVE